MGIVLMLFLQPYTLHPTPYTLHPIPDTRYPIPCPPRGYSMSMLGKMLGLGRSEHYDRGIRMFDQSLYEEAIVEFGRVVESPERDAVSERLALFYTAEAHASLGHRALKRGAWERALAHYEKALAIHPQYADLHFSQALALRRR